MPRLFSIFYSTTFSFLSFILLILLLVTPADSIRQAFNNRQLYNLAAIAGVYFVTGVLAILIYASRLYTNRSVLQGIPKAWVPIEKGDVNRKVEKVIREGLERSAWVAWEGRPRDLSKETARVGGHQERERERWPTSSGGAGDGGSLLCTSEDQRSGGQEESTISLPPVWGHIAHPGHSPPESPDLPNLHYQTVILELPHLIEAKAVSLVPSFTPQQQDTQLPDPDPQALALLQRPATMGLREYILHLVGMDAVHPAELARDFLAQYEYARFSTKGLTESEFRELMRAFSTILRGMTPLPENWVDKFNNDDDDEGDASLHSGSGGRSVSSGSCYTSVTTSSGRSGPTTSSSGGGSIKRSIQTTPHLAALPVRPSRHQRTRTISSRQTPKAPQPTSSPAPPRTPSPRKHPTNTLRPLGLGLSIPQSSSPPPRSLTPSPAPSRSPGLERRQTEPSPRTPLRPSQTWDTVITPGGDIWVGPSPPSPPASPFTPDVGVRRDVGEGGVGRGRRRGDSAGTFG